MQNPLVWLGRIRHRCGYGIHSPHAFALVTGVVYERGEYYAYKELDNLLPRWQVLLGGRQRKILRLLFRLANHARPQQMVLRNATPQQYAFAREGCRSAAIHTGFPDEKAQFLLLNDVEEQNVLCALDERSVLVLTALRRHLAYWRTLQQDERVRQTFDLWDVGICVLDKKLTKEDYIINF